MSGSMTVGGKPLPLPSYSLIYEHAYVLFVRGDTLERVLLGLQDSLPTICEESIMALDIKQDDDWDGWVATVVYG